MQTVHPPADSPTRPAWRIVRAWDGHSWRPALLEAWIRLPDGWVCRIRRYSYTATGGDVTTTETVRFDPAVIQPLQPGDIAAAPPVRP